MAVLRRQLEIVDVIIIIILTVDPTFYLSLVTLTYMYLNGSRRFWTKFFLTKYTSTYTESTYTRVSTVNLILLPSVLELL